MNGVSAQLGFAFFNCLGVLPLLIIDVIRVEVVHVDVWYVLALHAAICQRIPVEVIEPRVLL